MAGPYSQGGGGGIAGDGTVPDQFALDKPYDISGDPTAEKMQQIDEMLRYLYTAITRAQDGLDATGAGDVVGPSSAVDGDVVKFSGTTGKLIADGSKLVSSLVTGPASATAGDVPIFDATGKVLTDSGYLATDLAGILTGATGRIRIATKLLSASDIQTLNTVTVEVCPAPGADLRIIPVAMALSRGNNPNTNYSVNPTFGLVYQGSTTGLINSVTVNLTNVTGAATSQSMSVGSSAVNINADFSNTAVHVKTSAATANNGPAVTIVVFYIVVASTHA